MKNVWKYIPLMVSQDLLHLPSPPISSSPASHYINSGYSCLYAHNKTGVMLQIAIYLRYAFKNLAA